MGDCTWIVKAKHSSGSVSETGGHSAGGHVVRAVDVGRGRHPKCGDYDVLVTHPGGQGGTGIAGEGSFVKGAEFTGHSEKG